MEMNYCRRCGNELKPVEGHVYQCSSGHTIFANTSPATAAWLVTSSDEVVVVERGIEPGKGALDAPGGFVDGDYETLEEAMKRELHEELGLEPHQYSELKFLASGVDQYEYGNELIPVISAFYWARLNDDVNISVQDDVSDVFFVPVDEVDVDKLYFESAKKTLEILRDML